MATTVTSTAPPSFDEIFQQGKDMQAMNMEIMAGMQEINTANVLQQGMNNMFNAGIQMLSQTTASARDAFSAIGRNM